MNRIDLRSNLSGIVKSPMFKVVLRIFIIAIIAASLLLNIFTHVTPVVKYYGNAMSPSLKSGQILLLSKTQKVEQGDIIAFYYNNKILVRRVVATSGKQVNMDIFGNVSVNGTALDEPYLTSKSLGQNSVAFPYDVPQDCVFVLGDNRGVSRDSRDPVIGQVDKREVLGKAIFLMIPGTSHGDLPQDMSRIGVIQ